MIKIVYVTKNLSANGITNVVMNYGTRLEKKRFELTIITGAPVESIYRDRLCQENIRVVELPPKRKSPVAYYGNLWRKLKNGYDIIHIHGNSATITIELLLAKLAGIKVRIAHCHNVTCDHIVVHRMLQPAMQKLYTYGFACSDEAGKWLFGNSPYEVLTNAFQTEKFVFDATKRKKIRESLNIADKFVVGNVARFNEQKNHEFLLDVFEKVAEQRADAVLLLVGNGPNLEKIQKKITEHPYQDRIFYFGVTDRVEELYAAMDVFVLPTKYEGLGIVYIEAQINGLFVVTSDQVPQDVNITGRVIFLPLNAGQNEWCGAILGSEQINRIEFYKEHQDAIAIYDITRNIFHLETTYENLVKNECSE